MTEIFKIIKQNKEKLSTSRLHEVLTDTSISKEEKLKCIPSMTIFIMGFKDAMKLIKFKNPQSKIEKMVNTHADEDSSHWRWFLNDLKYLNQKVIRKGFTEVLAEMYKNEYMPVRSAVYTLMHYIKQYDDPIFRVMILEVLESGYEAFAQDMNPVIQEAGLYENLEFFGRKHNQAEADHEMDHVSEKEDDLENLLKNLSSTHLVQLESMLKDLYKNIYTMHEGISHFVKGEYSPV